MSNSKFMRGQFVQTPHLHIPADNTLYQIGAIDRVLGDISAVLLKDGKVVGCTPESCLKAAK